MCNKTHTHFHTHTHTCKPEWIAALQRTKKKSTENRKRNKVRMQSTKNARKICIARVSNRVKCTYFSFFFAFLLQLRLVLPALERCPLELKWGKTPPQPAGVPATRETTANEIVHKNWDQCGRDAPALWSTWIDRHSGRGGSAIALRPATRQPNIRAKRNKMRWLCGRCFSFASSLLLFYFYHRSITDSIRILFFLRRLLNF